MLAVAIGEGVGVELGADLGAANFARNCWPTILSAAKFWALASVVHLELQVDSP